MCRLNHLETISFKITCIIEAPLEVVHGNVMFSMGQNTAGNSSVYSTRYFYDSKGLLFYFYV